MCHLTLSWLLFSSIMSSMLKCHLCDFSRPIRLFLGSFLWRLLLNAHSTLPLESVFMSVSICIIEHWFRCWRQEETQRISCIKSVTPAPLSMTWTTKTFPFSPILTPKMKRKPFSSSLLSCLWQPKIIDWPNFVWQKIGQM